MGAKQCATARLKHVHPFQEIERQFSRHPKHTKCSKPQFPVPETSLSFREFRSGTLLKSNPGLYAWSSPSSLTFHPSRLDTRKTLSLLRKVKRRPEKLPIKTEAQSGSWAGTSMLKLRTPSLPAKHLICLRQRHWPERFLSIADTGRVGNLQATSLEGAKRSKLKTRTSAGTSE